MTQRIALVTGGSRGIGRAIAIRLARDGAAVAVNYREQREQAEQVVDAITRAGGRAVAIAGDIASSKDCTAIVDATRRALGPVDILVNNAAIFRNGELDSADDVEIEKMRNVN